MLAKIKDFFQNELGGNEAEKTGHLTEEKRRLASAALLIEVAVVDHEFDQKEIKVKQGETVSITLKNDQGNHGFKLEGYDKEVKNGQTVTFTADKAGEFNFECSIICGKGHADMKGKFIVE